MSTDTHEDTFGEALGDPAFAELLAELRELAERPAPPVGPELMAVLAGDLPHGVAPLAAARARRRRTASAVAIGAVATGVLAGGISAAAADELPAPVQRVVARVVNTITPFEIPDRGLHEQPDRDPAKRSVPPDATEPDEPDEQVTVPHEVAPSVPRPPTTSGSTATDSTSGTHEDERENEDSAEPSEEETGGSSEETEEESEEESED